MATTKNTIAPDATAVKADTTLGAGADAETNVGTDDACHTEHGYISTSPAT